MIKLSDLPRHFPTLKFHENFPLASLTTVKIGGPAELFVETPTTKDFIDLMSEVKKNQISVTILGWGANSLIADRGISGLVVKNTAKEIDVDGTSTDKSNVSIAPPARWQSDDSSSNKKYEFQDLDYDESDAPQVKVRIASGVGLPVAINSLLQQGITGLQWYSRIPATVGGAIFNNLHGGTHFISEVIDEIQIISPTGELQSISAKEAEFGYDFSRFHHSQEVIVSADFLLFQGDVERAKQVVIEWAKRKAIQPQNSLGCIFQNLTPEQQQKLDVPTPSIGYVIDQVLHRKGFRIGDAMVSEKHCAFIENVGQATAADYLEVIKTILTDAQQQLGIQLKPEIFFLGFEERELKGVL